MAENRERRVIVNFFIDPSIKKKYESIITLRGYSTLSEALREHIREVVKKFEEEKGNG